MKCICISPTEMQMHFVEMQYCIIFRKCNCISVRELQLHFGEMQLHITPRNTIALYVQIPPGNRFHRPQNVANARRTQIFLPCPCRTFKYTPISLTYFQIYPRILYLLSNILTIPYLLSNIVFHYKKNSKLGIF